MPSFSTVKCTVEGVTRCLETLNSGGVIVFPTDTVYGIGCDPYNDSAVERLFRIKAREPTKPLPVLAYSQDDAEKIVDLRESGRLLARTYWPGKLTILAPLLDRSMSSRLTASRGTLGVRVPANECTLQLLQKCRYLVGTSANISGNVPLRSAEDVQLSGLVGFDMLLDGGTLEPSRESTVIDIQSLSIIRQGAVAANEIYQTLGRKS